MPQVTSYKIEEVGFHPRAVCTKALPLLGLGPFPPDACSPVGITRPSGKNRQRLRGIEKRVLGIKEGFLGMVAFEMSLEGQVDFEREALEL